MPTHIITSLCVWGISRSMRPPECIESSITFVNRCCMHHFYRYSTADLLWSTHRIDPSIKWSTWSIYELCADLTAHCCCSKNGIYYILFSIHFHLRWCLKCVACDLTTQIYRSAQLHTDDGIETCVDLLIAYSSIGGLLWKFNWH